MLQMEMKIDWQTWDKRMLKLQKFPQHVAILSKQLTETAVVRLQKLTPRSEQGPRHLADRWEYKVSQLKNDVYIQIYNNATSKTQQAILTYLEKGTKAHAIEPKKKARLAFIWLERACFAKHVEHPGTKAYRMVGMTRDWLTSRFRAAGKELLSRFSKTWREE